jgi:hypothetical protein
MRKLLVLLLVFAMTSWANAAIVSFSAGDGLPGDTIGITVSSDEQVWASLLPDSCTATVMTSHRMLLLVLS